MIKVRSPGSATIINAISTGCGSAFGVQLYVDVEVKLNSGSKIKCSSDQDVDTTLMEICAKNVLKLYQMNIGANIHIKSTLPVASGLSSSSAVSNGVTMALEKAIVEENMINSILDEADLLNMAVDSSLEAGVTITGAFDDASASFYGGISVTNNLKREIIRNEKWNGQNILIYMPDKKSPTAETDVARMKLLAPWVKLAFKEVLKGNIYHALSLNGLLYCSALHFDPDIALDALQAGASAAGLSGTGPSFVAIAEDEISHKVVEAWDSYPGRVIKTKVDNQGTQVIARE